MKADDDILLIYFGNEYCIIMMHLKILIEEWMDWGIVLASYDKYGRGGTRVQASGIA